MNVEDFVRYIRNRRYPSDLTEGEIHQAWEDAQTTFQLVTPLRQQAYFNIIASKQVYDVFDRSNTSPPEMVDPMGFKAFDIIWTIQPDHTTDPFFQGPYLGPYNGSPILPFSSNNLWNASDAYIYTDDLNLMTDNFFNTSWEHVDNDPSSPVRLMPVPLNNGTAFIQYYRRRELATLHTVAPLAYKMWAEAEICRLLARSEAPVAGKKFALFEDRGSAVKWWTSEAERLEGLGRAQLDVAGISYVSPTGRS